MICLSNNIAVLSKVLKHRHTYDNAANTSWRCKTLMLGAGCTAAASAHQHSTSATSSAHLELADAKSALPLTPRPRPPVCGASGLGRGVSPPNCHATLGGTPGASCFSRSCVRPSFSGPVALTFACWSAGTRLIFATAAANLLNVRLWTSPSCSEPTRANFGGQLAFQMCCCPESCMIQQLGTLSSAS